MGLASSNPKNVQAWESIIQTIFFSSLLFRENSWFGLKEMDFKNN